MLTALEKALFAIGLDVRQLFKHGKSIGIITLITTGAMLLSGYYGILESAFKLFQSDGVPQKAERAYSTDISPSTLPDTTSLISVPRIFMGTLPPDGLPGVKYFIWNGSESSIKSMRISTWVLVGNALKMIDERQTGYLAKAAQTVVELRSPISYGKAILCVSYTNGNRNMEQLHFFQSVGDFERYGPLRELEQFRDPIIEAGGSLCRSMPQIALAQM